MVTINFILRSICKVLFVILLHVPKSSAQSAMALFDPASVKNYTHINGLPQNSVNDFCFDKLGYMWIATWDGLSRFDGQYFKNNFGYSSSFPLKAKVLQFFKKNTDTIYALTTEQKVFVITNGKVVGYETYSANKQGVLLRYSQVAAPYPKNIHDSDLLGYAKKNVTDIQYAYPGFRAQGDSFGIIGNKLLIYTSNGLVKTLTLPNSNFNAALHNGSGLHLLQSNIALLNNSTNSLDLFSRCWPI